MDTNKEPFKKANLEGQRDAKGRFLPGHAGNPNAKGRPRKELCITSILREQLGEPCPYAPGKTWAEWVARRALELAGENPTYYKELLDRVEGKVVQTIEEQIKTDVVFIIGKGYADPKTGEVLGRSKEIGPSESA